MTGDDHQPGSGEPHVAFRTTLLAHGKTATGFVVPADAVAHLGKGKRPPVRVSIRDHTYASTVAVMGGEFMIGVSAENRQKAGVAAGDEIDVVLTLDTTPRVVSVPADFAEALAAEDARAFFDSLSASQKQWHVVTIEAAKTDETRRRRIEKSLGLLRQGKAR
jgi:hypothetical protein